MTLNRMHTLSLAGALAAVLSGSLGCLASADD